MTDSHGAVDRESAPAPDHPAKPDSPTDLTKRSWLYVLRKTVREFLDDQCTDLAAALTYYAVLGIFPAALALTSILGLVKRDEQAVKTVLEVLTSTARNLNPKGRDDLYGWGLIDPAAALQELDSRIADGKLIATAKPTAPKAATKSATAPKAGAPKTASPNPNVPNSAPRPASATQPPAR